MLTLEYILNKYKLENKDYIEIPGVGRDDLAKILPELGFKTGVEVGVFRGIYSELLCKANPQMKFYGVDPWESYVINKNDGPVSQELCDFNYKRTCQRMARYNYEAIRKSSMEAVKDFEDESLDFVYIDGNHEYSHVMNDVTEWSKKVRKGGMVSGHDYYRVKDVGSLMHVKDAVNDYVKANNISPLIIWGADYIPPGTKPLKRDKGRSWSFIKN